MALAVSPFMAQEALPSVTDEEQQIDQTIDQERQRVERDEMQIPGREQEEQVPEEKVLESEEIQFEDMESQDSENVELEELEMEPEEMEYEEPVYEEPVYEEPVYEEPVYEEPVYEEPVYEEPVYEEPVYEEAEYEDMEYEDMEQEMQEQQKPQRREVQTLMSGSGGYGAISVGYTEVNNLPALMMGVSAEWVIGHGFGLGFKGVGFTSDLTPVNDHFYALSGGYGGLVMEPIIVGWLPVHLAFPITIGGGGLASYSTSADLWTDDFDPYFGEYSVFFVAEAGAELEFNLVKFFRLALFGSYRWTTNLEMKPMYGLVEPSPYHVGNHALYGWSFGARFKFGSF